MTIGIAFVLTATLVVAGVIGFRRLRPSSPSDSDMGRVSQSWLMEQRADGQRDRFS
ncbi:MAG: hypothetical protein ABL971_07185 [Vicinamibacterales bacterium]